MELEIVSNPRRLDLPITVRAPDGVDLKVPRWMTDPAAEELRCSEHAALSLTAIRAVIGLVAARDAAKASVVPAASGAQAKDGRVPDVAGEAPRSAHSTDDGVSVPPGSGRARSGDARSGLRDEERPPRGRARSRGAAR